MSFASPGRLLLVVVPLALLVAYVLVQRSRRKYALRFTSVDLLASVAPRRPGWQRHISAALMLFAVLALVVGLAGPTRNVRVAARARHDHARDRHVGFDGRDRRRAQPARGGRSRGPHASSRSCRTGLKVGLLALRYQRPRRVARRHPITRPCSPRSTTSRSAAAPSTGDAIYQSLDAIAALPKDAERQARAGCRRRDERRCADDRPQRRVAGADRRVGDRGGQAGRRSRSTRSRSARRTARSRSRARSCRCRPTRRRWSRSRRAAAASRSRPRARTQLNSVYDQIRKSVGYDTVRRDMTAWFTGLGLVLLILTAGAALVWTQRIV